MQFFREYFETDPNKKDAAWANNVITKLRTYWKPLYSSAEAKENMDIILSRYNMASVMKMFKDPKKLGMEFLGISIMEKVRNILIGESTKAGVTANINCLDPVGEHQRKKDISLLTHRKDIEELLSHLQTSIGLPEYNMHTAKNVSGKSPYHGNLEQFDELGLDSSNPADRGYFVKAWYRLKHEMDAQQIVNAFLNYNEVSENIENWVNDLLAKKVISKQAYVNEMTGAYTIGYQSPESIRLIPGRKANGKDAVCIGYEENCTVADVIKKIGNTFDMNEEWSYLVNAVNFANKTDFTGLWDGNGNIMYGAATDAKNAGSCALISDFLTFKIQMGYIEFKSLNESVYKMGVDYHGNLRMYSRDVNYVNEDSGYKKESRFNEYTYKSYFFATSTNTQRLYKYGKLYHQLITGAEDEYSSFSIGFKKVTGPTVAEVARPWIEIAQEAFTKYRWMVRRAKPKGRSYNYESLVQIGKHMVKEGNSKQQVHEVIKMFEEGINEIFTIPKVDGQRVGGGIIPNQDLPNGLDATAITFQAIVDWATNKIKDDLGINDIREAYSPKQNDVYKLQMATLESSRNATQYIGGTIDALMRDVAKDCLLTIQDIVSYKESLAYKFLLDMVGESTIQSIEDLDNIAMHRYGTFVNNFSTYVERQKMLTDTEQAWMAGEITYDTKLLINSIDDYRKAAYILSFEKQRADKLKEKQLQDAQNREMQQIAAKHQSKIEEINAQGDWHWKAQDRTGWWNFMTQKAQDAAKIQNTEQKAQHKTEEIVQKTDQSIREQAAQSAIQTQQP